MKLFDVLSDSKELLQIAAEKIAESSKPAMFVYSYTFTAGFVAMVQWFVGILPTLCMLVGFIGSVILANSNRKKSEREGIEKDIAKIKLRMAREEMKKMGIETRDEDHL